MKVSIRSKLTILILGVCLAIILVIWFNIAVLFKPMYYAMTERQLTDTLDRIAGIIEDNGGVLTGDVYREIREASASNMCIEISRADGKGVWLSEGIGDSCQIHCYELATSKDDHGRRRNLDSRVAMGLREDIAENGGISTTLTDVHDNRQLVVGSREASGYVVIVSTNLVQAAPTIDIVTSQLQSSTFIAVVLALMISAILSNWFIGPIMTLSSATKEVAKGNYKLNIPVSDEYNDEFGQLAHDFNRMVDQIEDSQQLQRELVASISHDLRTPLTIIKGYAESIRDITGDNKEIRDRQLNTIMDEADRLTGMVNTVMEYSKLNRDNYKLNIVQYNIADMCNDIVDFYAGRAREEGRSITYEGPDEVYVMADASLIERVLHNFVSNALQHTDLGTEVKVRVQVLDSAKVKVSVADRGEGISEEDQKHIFDKYYRARKDSGKQGTGLGLAIVKAILENHGFSYGVDSAPGEGSEFWFIM